MRAGCNVGGCHGAARGKDGFRLSLFGFDPDGDHYRLTRELQRPAHQPRAAGREPAAREGDAARCRTPAASGSRRATSTTRRIVRWLEADAPADPPTVAAAGELEVFPPTAVLDGKGEKQRIVVRAKYSDGTDRDVTHLALFLTQQRQRREDRRRRRRDRRRARRGVRHGPLRTPSPSACRSSRCRRACSSPGRTSPENNYIDTLVHDKLKKLRIEPSALCTTRTFVRRVYLDIIGVLPTPEEYARFMVGHAAEQARAARR